MLKIERSLSRIVQETYQARKKKNAAYSLRAYAKFLQISPATLHSLLLGNETISRRTLSLIADKVGLSKNELAYFSNLAKMRSAKQSDKRAAAHREALKFDTRFNLVSDEQFSELVHWYTFAVMELIKTQDFKHDTRWIAERLQISEAQAREAIESLKRLEVIQVTAGGKFEVLRDFVALPSGKPLRAASDFHQKVVDKARQAMETQPKGTRNFSGTVLRFRKSEMDRVDEFITRFRREFCTEFEDGDGHDSVYALAVQFFRLG